jgi:proteasome lid subunit RPN8/RPN11
LANKDTIAIPRLVWAGLTGELHKRGRGRRESGAFLMGRAGPASREVVSYICYDDLDPKALTHGIVEFHRAGFSKLWDICKERRLKVIADAHTHPTADVRQSQIDKAHPMVPVRGHVALILPNFGNTSRWSLAPVGVHRFEGAGQWESFRPRDATCPIQLTWW